MRGRVRARARARVRVRVRASSRSAVSEVPSAEASMLASSSPDTLVSSSYSLRCYSIR